MNYYKSISLKNFGILKKESEVKLGSITFIYGPNGAGKSTFIRSIEQFEKVRRLAIEGYPIKQEADKLFERYGTETDAQKITINYGIEANRIREIKNNYFMSEGEDGFGDYLSYSDLERKEAGDATNNYVNISLRHVQNSLDIKNSAILEILGLKKNSYTFSISKGNNVEYFYNPERAIVFNADEICLTKIKKNFVLPKLSVFRLSGRISTPNHEILRSMSCEWVNCPNENNTKKIIE